MVAVPNRLFLVVCDIFFIACMCILFEILVTPPFVEPFEDFNIKGLYIYLLEIIVRAYILDRHGRMFEKKKMEKERWLL